MICIKRDSMCLRWLWRPREKVAVFNFSVPLSTYCKIRYVNEIYSGIAPFCPR